MFGLLLGAGCPNFHSSGETGDNGDRGDTGTDTTSITTTLGASSGMSLTTESTADDTTASASTTGSATTTGSADSTQGDTIAEEDSDSTDKGDSTSTGDGSSSSTGRAEPVGEWANCQLGESCVAEVAACLVERAADTPDSICVFPCDDVGECPPPPATGDPTVVCDAIPNADTQTPVCYLSCAAGERCPSGMYCHSDVCWYANVDPYEACNGASGNVCPDGSRCVGNGGLSMCGPGCEGMDPDECPPFPVMADPLECEDLGGVNGAQCHLPCSVGNQCPQGWECVNGTFCAQTDLGTQ